MEIFSPSSLAILIILSFIQTGVVSGNSNSNGISIFQDGAALKTKTKTRAVDPPIKASTCPNDSTIAPCTCRVYSQGLGISCSGPAVNQTTVENVFGEIRQVNQISQDRGLLLDQFTVGSTELTQLDLAPFYGSGMNYLLLVFNANLTKLVTSGNPEDHGSIHVGDFYLWLSPLKMEGFGDALKYFSDELNLFNADGLDLNNKNSSGESEFLPGLSALQNLTYLYLTNSNITGQLDSDSWNFRGLQRSGIIITLSSNQINGIGENVFAFDLNESDGLLMIDLNMNKLNETSFHSNSGIARAGRRTTLLLGYNQFTTLPFEIFQPFLDINPRNYLSIDKNPLICDGRVSWLKARRDELLSRVIGANCSNDPGHTVFDSDLIP